MIAIDGPNFCWRAHHSGKELKSRGRPTGSLFVSLLMLSHLPDLFEPQRVVFLWDDTRCWKKEKFPEYKANRAEMDQTERTAVHKQIDIFRQVLKDVGTAQVQEEGLEADDLAGLLIKKENKPVILVSSDKDWFQLIRPWVTLVRGWSGKKLETMDAKGVTAKYGVHVLDWPKYQALVGDKGDNIPKVKVGMGPVTARMVLGGTVKLTVEERQRFTRNLWLTSILTETKRGPNIDIPKRLKSGWAKLESVIEYYEMFDLWTRRRQIWAVGGWGR